MKLTISSGKGGTGKTFIATNLSYILNHELDQRVTYLDCDVEEPNGHLFLTPKRTNQENITIEAPIEIDNDKCVGCGKCAEVCTFNAMAVINNKAMLFPELCHVCGACSIVCPKEAIQEGERNIGSLIQGESKGIYIWYGLLKHGEGGMSPRLIKEVKKYTDNGINILDSPPGTSCSAVETVIGSDLCVLITDLTPFGLHDLKLSVDMCRSVGIEPVVLINRGNLKDPGVRKYCKKEELDIIGEIPDDRKIAEAYSKGDLIVETLPQYKKVFVEIAENLIKTAKLDRKVKAQSQINHNFEAINNNNVEELSGDKVREARIEENNTGFNELVVVSGKGGTGKTSITATLAALAKDTVVSDCDVDASDLHLILEPKLQEKGLFSGGFQAHILKDQCIGCGKCFQACRFEAIYKKSTGEGYSYEIDEFSCEGCGVCKLVCDYDAVELEKAINGEWYTSEVKYGTMAHAKLEIAEENSGKLVTYTRDKAMELANRRDKDEIFIDGSPGTGCPVIASLTGAKYALVITEPTVSGIHDMERIIDLCKFFEISLGVIVNKCDINQEMTEKIKQRVYNLNVDFLGSLPYDETVTEAQIEGQSILEYAPNSEVAIKMKECFDKLKERMYG
ncbi:P-loop NTPase [Natranaerobius trueperi]|uniref:Cobyrinic acid ac-diamide synthase n=1 Tax=Natranaerobius trueperi TaxID=759412 RepID=A0A226BXW6_9FIRM|nr:P-loop NTPase [Natranaerobius trueperi]OWZ83853.1 cobyrinic acid ac-diamide synthase [Natranaerobius trueperi]